LAELKFQMFFILKVAHIIDYWYIRGDKTFSIQPTHAQLTCNIRKNFWDM